MADEPDVLRELGRVREHVIPELGQGDVERLVAVAARKRERRRIRRSLGLGLAIGAVSASVLWLAVRMPALGGGPAAIVASGQGVASAAATSPAAAPVPSSLSAPRAALTWALSDQSRATALNPATDVVVEEDGPQRALVRLERGRARFEVARRPERTFRVRAGSVTVSVIGTVFDVEVVADRIGVTVEQGAVEVAWGVGQKRLVAGEQGWFPPLVLSGGDAASATGAPAATFAPDSVLERSGPAVAAQTGPASARELLAESDAARTRGEPDRGAELLRRILREHPGDARAPLAAFTLGRLLLNELGKPREAAAAFHELQRRAPRGQFAEDALAREVEAWKQASEPARARAAAETYVERYPAGRHLRRVKALAGLE
jgi:transmembrane sensor